MHVTLHPYCYYTARLHPLQCRNHSYRKVSLWNHMCLMTKQHLHRFRHFAHVGYSIGLYSMWGWVGDVISNVTENQSCLDDVTRVCRATRSVQPFLHTTCPWFMSVYELWSSGHPFINSCWCMNHGLVVTVLLHDLNHGLVVSNRAHQLYKNISMLFLFPVKDDKLSTGVIAIFNASCYG